MSKKKARDSVYWVVLTRRFLTWKSHSLYETHAAAKEAERALEELGHVAKIERVELITN